MYHDHKIYSVGGSSHGSSLKSRDLSRETIRGGTIERLLEDANVLVVGSEDDECIEEIERLKALSIAESLEIGAVAVLERLQIIGVGMNIQELQSRNVDFDKVRNLTHSACSLSINLFFVC